MKRELFNTCICALCLSLLVSCEDAETGAKDYPYLKMDKVDVLTDGALFQAEVESLGNQEILSYGFVWNESGGTLFENWFRKELTGPLSAGTFNAEIHTDIQQGQVYYVRPFITTDEKTVYGPPAEFTGKGSKTAKVLDYGPKAGFDGTLIRLKGEYFSLRQANLSVFVDGHPAEIVRCTEDSLVFKIPVSPLIGWATFKIVSSGHEMVIVNAFEVYGPEIYESSVTEGFPGDIITIRGKYLTHYGTPSLRFNGIEAEIIEAGEELITAAIPVAYSALYDQTVDVWLFTGQKFSSLDTWFTIKKTWETKAATPFDWSWVYNAFSYNGKGYILEQNSKILYDYDPVTDTWSPGSSFPGERDENNIFITAGNMLLKMGGVDHLGPVNSFWEYDFNTEEWTRLDDIPFSFTYSTHVSLNGVEYIITNTGQVWTLDHASRVFTRKNDFVAPVTGFLFAYEENNGIYLTTYGSDWSYNAASDTWTSISENPFEKDNYFVHAIGYYLNGTAYVLEDGVDLYKYYPERARWVLCGHYPGGRGDNSYKTAFVIGDYAYIAATSSNYAGCAPLLFAYSNL
jgi:hypothetical protein